ncbi:MAG: ATP-binding protein [Pseudohongiellaceae bacterium]|jgi:two-component system sensor histidine kinase PilS (NtrC family)
MAEKTDQYTGQISNVAVVYNIYRIVLPLVLLVTYISSPDNTQFGEVDPTLFVQACTGYAIFGVVIAFLSPDGTRFLENQQILTSTLIADILAISLLIFSSGGVASGLGLLMIVTIASSSIMIRGRISTFLAAIAALAIIYSELYLALSLQNPPGQFIQTGFLGIILFATSLYIQTLTDRIYRAATLADQQASDIVDLEKLNNEIIQRMRTGVVVVDTNNHIVSMNSAAQSTLAPLLAEADSGNGQPSSLPDKLAEQLNLWKINSKRQPPPIAIPESKKQVQINFAFLNPGSESDVLMFLEDNRQIVQRIRQMKLASLGRLTASIAHEVRNPLGAISHASQLLRESETASSDDKRMLEIILNHCSRINMIIEEVLDASRQDESTPTRINLKSWLSSFVASYRDTHELCDEITISIEPDTTEINVITGQLEQVLNNLFDNGLRYSHKQTGRATLTILGGIDSKDNLVQPYLSVIDDGPGIADEDEAQLFEPFHTTEASGTGLGLYISKELCEANQSQLLYSRTSDGKSCFSIYFSDPDHTVD